MKATLTCPKCEFEEDKEMPEDSCLAFYRCTGCEKLIRTKSGCCVFCEYSDKKCPSKR